MTSKNTEAMSPNTTTVSTKLRARFVCLFCLSVFFTTGWVQAQRRPTLEKKVPKAASVVFRLEPASATVWRQTGEGVENYLGRSDERVTVGLTEQEAAGDRDLLIRFKIRLWFSTWESAPEFVSAATLMESQSYPKSGRHSLQLTGWQRFQANTAARPGLVLGVSFALLFVIGGGAYTAKRRRHSVVEETALLPGYTLGGLLGRGGMGEVYRAVDRQGQEYAVKLLKSSLSESPEFRKVFDRELSIGSKLKHPNLPALYGYGIALDGRVYMISPLLHGSTLKDALPVPKLERARMAAEVLEQVGSALDYLHQSGLVHQDVKPSNIFLKDDGVVMLMDLGIARPAEQAEEKVVGSPLYMAPEAFQGQAGTRSDQYSLGLVIYEVLAAGRPFEERDPAVLMHRRLEPVDPLPDYGAEINEPLSRMLNPDPTKRFDDLESARRALTDRLISTDTAL